MNMCSRLRTLGRSGRVVWRWGVLVLCSFPMLAVGLATPAAAQEPSAGAIEASIQSLREPIDHEQVSEIFVGLARLDDANERDRLQAMFDQRMQALMELPSRSMEQAAVDGVSFPSHDELAFRIETLALGPQATVEDLRARDQLVAEIAAIVDPVRREELLAKLEERERSANVPAWETQ